jgi:hypothetical protein
MLGHGKTFLRAFGSASASAASSTWAEKYPEYLKAKFSLLATLHALLPWSHRYPHPYANNVLNDLSNIYKELGSPKHLQANIESCKNRPVRPRIYSQGLLNALVEQRDAQREKVFKAAQECAACADKPDDVIVDLKGNNAFSCPSITKEKPKLKPITPPI